MTFVIFFLSVAVMEFILPERKETDRDQPLPDSARTASPSIATTVLATPAITTHAITTHAITTRDLLALGAAIQSEVRVEVFASTADAELVPVLVRNVPKYNREDDRVE